MKIAPTLALARRTLWPKSRRFLLFFAGRREEGVRHSTLSDADDGISEIERLNEVIATGDTEESKRKALKIEYEFFTYVGEPVPTTVTEKMTQMLIDQPSSTARKKLWANFGALEEQAASKKETLKRRAAHRMRNIETMTRQRLRDEFEGVLYDENGVSVAGPPHVILPKVDPGHVIKRQRYNMTFARNFGQSLVLDMGLSSRSTNQKSINDMQRQVSGLYSANRMHHEPFNIYLCNFSTDSLAHRPLVENETTSNYLWNVSSQCFTSRFPKSRILYLSPFAKSVWTDYNHDDVIVIGAYGKGESPDHSALVKKYKLRTARLNTAPYFVNRRPPSFRLTDMMQIITDARDTNGDWLYAFRLLGGEFSPVEWKPRYHFMKRRLENLEKDDRKEEELLIKAKERVYVNERTIFKCRSKLLCYDTE